MKLMGGRRTLRPPPPPGRPDILGYGIWDMGYVIWDMGQAMESILCQLIITR